MRRGFQEPDTYDADDDGGPSDRDGDPDDDGDGWEPDEDQVAEHRIEQ